MSKLRAMIMSLALAFPFVLSATEMELVLEVVAVTVISEGLLYILYTI